MRKRRARHRILVGVLSAAVVALSAGIITVGALTAFRSVPAQADAAIVPAATALPVPQQSVAPPEPSPVPTPTPTSPPAPVVPADDGIHPTCAGPTTMSVWAHADDDLLFLGSQISDSLAAGGCVRTVFLTDGDAGRGADYAAGRVRGIQRAYDVMRGAPGEWSEQKVILQTGATVTVRRPNGDTRVSLIFLHLPDGNLSGQGYPATGEVSLAKLASDKILTIGATTGQAALSWSALVASVDELITAFQPASFFTHVPGSAHALAKGDHADHAITGILARNAWRQSDRVSATIGYAMGYQTAQHPSNVGGEALSRKIAAFAAYAADDPVVNGCRDEATCLATPRFGAWLSRQYVTPENGLGLG